MNHIPPQDQEILDSMKALSERRLILKRALTPEVRAAIRETFGIDELIFAFDEEGNSIKAARRDTMRGVVLTLEFEADHADETRKTYNEMIQIANHNPNH